MSSSVSYISRSNSIGEKASTRNTNYSLGFDINDPTTDTPLGSGQSPTEGKKLSVNYGTSGSISKSLSLNDIVTKLNDTVFIPNSSDTSEKAFVQTSNYYNRFKVANPNLSLQRGFAHVFFTRPSCYLLDGINLRKGLEANETFYYTWRKSPNVVRDLVSANGLSHDFMLTLSNAASSFSLSDEYINSDTYGRTYTGYKIAYGKNDIESKTAGDFSITYTDDRDLHIYQLHRLWVEYISGCYRGEIAPASGTIFNKILDYTCSCYYILTAEDNETIIFWSKYYGVLPTTIPSSQYSWGTGNLINNPSIDISYKYSYKRDFNPYSILEFNYNSRVDKNGAAYQPMYDAALNHVGPTWVGAPFIELVKSPDNADKYVYKLRFRKAEL